MITIRRYQPGDNGAVRELHVLALQPTGAIWDDGPWDQDLENIEGVYLANRGEFLVGTQEDRLVAMGALRCIDDTRAEIKRMRVHPDFQRQGFGRQILSRLESRARELGYTSLRLDTSVLQTPALQLYRSFGFVETHRKKMHGLECIFMEKEIG